MTAMIFKNGIAQDFLSGLQTKMNFDNVNGKEKKMPELESSSTQNQSKLETASTTEKLDTSSVLEISNLRKPQVGNFMSVDFYSEGFLKLPRNLLSDPRWKELRIKYQKVFLTILFHTAYTEKSHSILGNIVKIQPGQFCTSIRNLIDLCNDGVKFNEDKVDKNIVERSVSLFIKLQLVRQEVRHGKSIFTITYPELYDHFKTQSETQSETKVRLNRDTNEERKERKEIKETIDGAIALDSSLFDNEKKEPKINQSVFSPKKTNQENSLSEEKKNHYAHLWEYIVKNSMNHGFTPNQKPGIKEKDLLTWLGTYEGLEIQDCLKMTLEAIPNRTWAGYMTKILTDRVSKKEEDSISGRRIVEGTVKKNKMEHIELKKDYFVDLISKDQMYYHINPETLNNFLKRSYDRAMQYKAEEKKMEKQTCEY